jgi:[lysine-biosynthesis-protein LysW]--L-2-aminoadipate ligase
MNLTGNKLLTSLKLIENDIPTPLTCIAYKDEPAIEAIEQVVQYPTIIKPLIGSWGRLIAKLDDHNSAMSILEAREAMGNVLQKIFYLQKNIIRSNLETPTDLRVFVVGDKCVAAMGRYNPEKDFRSNIAIGGTAKPVEISEEIEKLSLQASKAVKGEIVGVDLMEDNGKLSVIEVNGTPQFKGVGTVTNINIAAEIVDYLIENYH